LRKGLRQINHKEKTMKVLIIGGSGNISTAITRNLVERGEDVTLFNNDSKDVENEFKCKRIFGDRTDFPRFEAQMKDAGAFDCVIDMICYHPPEAESDLRAFQGRVGQFIFCSTIDVYVKPSPLYPVRETAVRKANPAFEYAYHKVLCEQIFEGGRDQGFPLTIIRPAATYNDTWCPIGLIGSGQTFLKRIRQGRPVIVLGNGQSFWVSTHRDDVGRAFANAVGNPKVIGHAYHVTGEELMTWEGYYQTVVRVMQAPPLNPVFIPAKLLARMAPKAASWSDWNFQYSGIFDNTAAHADLDFRFTIPWEEGVRRMVKHQDASGAIDNAEDNPLYEKIVSTWLKMEEQIIQDVKPFDI
jgi:nucleoside-diphosphate-sugar epimerase